MAGRRTSLFPRRPCGMLLRPGASLFHGSLTYRRVPAGLRVADEAALSEAVVRGLVKVDAFGYRAAALEARKETGELLPGVEIAPECEHFGIRFGEDSREREVFGE